MSVRLPVQSYRRLRVAAAKHGLSMGAYLTELWEDTAEAKSDADGNAVLDETTS